MESVEHSQEPRLEQQDLLDHLDHLVLEHPNLLDHLVQSRTSPDEEEELIMTSCSLCFSSHEHFGFEVQIKMREATAPPTLPEPSD